MNLDKVSLLKDSAIMLVVSFRAVLTLVERVYYYERAIALEFSKEGRPDLMSAVFGNAMTKDLEVRQAWRDLEITIWSTPSMLRLVQETFILNMRAVSKDDPKAAAQMWADLVTQNSDLARKSST